MVPQGPLEDPSGGFGWIHLYQSHSFSRTRLGRSGRALGDKPPLVWMGGVVPPRNDRVDLWIVGGLVPLSPRCIPWWDPRAFDADQVRSMIVRATL